MDNLTERLLKKFSEFLTKIIYGLEGYTYKDKHIGIGVGLIIYIGLRPNCTMTDISHYLNVIPSTSTRRVEKLVKFGIVKRSISEEDRRLIFLNLTDEGKEIYEHFMEKRFISVSYLVKQFKEEEINSVISFLDFFIKESANFIDS